MWIGWLPHWYHTISDHQFFSEILTFLLLTKMLNPLRQDSVYYQNYRNWWAESRWFMKGYFQCGPDIYKSKITIVLLLYVLTFSISHSRNKDGVIGYYSFGRKYCNFVVSWWTVVFFPDWTVRYSTLKITINLPNCRCDVLHSNTFVCLYFMCEWHLPTNPFP